MNSPDTRLTAVGYAPDGSPGLDRLATAGPRSGRLRRRCRPPSAHGDAHRRPADGPRRHRRRRRLFGRRRREPRAVHASASSTRRRVRSARSPKRIAASQAAVEYINTELGGFDGHMIELDKCADRRHAGLVAALRRGDGQRRRAVRDRRARQQHAGLVLDPRRRRHPGDRRDPDRRADFAAENSYFFVAGGAAAYPGSGRRTSSTSCPTSRRSASSPMTPRARPRRSRSCTSRWRPRASTVNDVQVPATQSDWLAPFTAGAGQRRDRGAGEPAELRQPRPGPRQPAERRDDGVGEQVLQRRRSSKGPGRAA